MPCYHPLVGIFDGEYLESGKKKLIIQGNIDPHWAKITWPGSVVIPCGRCIGCRIDYSRSWADRMMLELETAGKGIFVTLTYDNEHLTYCHSDEYGIPDQGTLNKRDVQLFLKRLRKYFTGKEIRFYLAGEYGDHTFRPHYHAILFGIGLDDFPDRLSHGQNELHQTYYISDTLARIWNNGFVLISDVSWKTCAYVARYVTKKVKGDRTIYYDLVGAIPEFALMSRRPGLGRRYLDAHPDCLDYQNISLTTPEGGLKLNIPKYFLKQLDNPGTEKNPNYLYDPERYAILKEQRREFAEDRMFLKLSKTNLSYLDYLESEENAKLSKLKALRRCSV